MKEKFELWAAALQGLLARQAQHGANFTANSVHLITEQCQAFADRAAQDLEEYRQSLEPRPPDVAH